MPAEAKPKAGLEDVVAATSAICYLDGDRGVLAYYGYDIHDLARGATFEEVCYLLWHGRLPSRAELGDLQSQLAAGRPLEEPILRLMKQLPATDGMDSLRTLTSALGHYDRDASDQLSSSELSKGRAADGAAGEYRRDLRADAGRRRADPAGPRARACRELSLHADGQSSECAVDAGVRHCAGPARGSRAERVHVRCPRGGRDSD